MCRSCRDSRSRRRVRRRLRPTQSEDSPALWERGEQLAAACEWHRAGARERIKSAITARGPLFAHSGCPIDDAKLQLSTSYEPAMITQGASVERPEEGPFAGSGLITRMDSMGFRVTALIEADGWYLVRTKGSHRQYRHPTKPGTVTVAGKPSTDIPIDTERNIRKQAGI